MTKHLRALEQPHVAVDLSTRGRDKLHDRDYGRFRACLLAGAVVAVLVGLYARVLPVWLEDLWDDPNYSHVFIVPVISGFVVWQRRRILAALPIRGSWRGIPLIVAGLAALIGGDIGAETCLMRTSLIVILTGLVLFHFGTPMLRSLAFPLGFCLFLVPVPAIFFFAVTARLQQLAAESGATILDLLGVTVFLEGNVIHLSSLTLGVTEACSGIRSLMTLVALGVAWAHLMLPKFWMQIVLVVLVLPITVVANAGRIVITGLVGRAFGVEYAEGFFHYFSGWLVFVAAVLGMLALHGVLRAVTSRQGWEAA